MSTAGLRVAVIGSGPSGLYAADALTKTDPPTAQVDVIDRLPAPYGLVRYGVAPDHHKIKQTITTFERILVRPPVRFFGCVELGTDLTAEDLLAHYDAVIYATGAMVDRKLGIPGEDLPGSISSTAFVNWYSGHPDAAQPVELDAESVAVIGVGNVAVDVARVLAKNPVELHDTDLPPLVRAALASSKVREIHVVGRRGPEQAKFTTKELRELGELEDSDIFVDARDKPGAPADDVPKAIKANVATIAEWADATPHGKERIIRLRFWLKPVEILGTDRVEGLRVERAVLDAEGNLRGTGEFEEIPCQIVVRAVGYKSVPLPGVPFDEREALVPNEAGRVLGEDGKPKPGEYVTGWIKRGPTGVIGTNKGDAAETVASLLEDAAAPGSHRATVDEPVEVLLESRGVSCVTWEGWLAIDADEIERGRPDERKRVKVPDWETMRALAKR